MRWLIGAIFLSTLANPALSFVFERNNGMLCSGTLAGYEVEIVIQTPLYGADGLVPVRYSGPGGKSLEEGVAGRLFRTDSSGALLFVETYGDYSSSVSIRSSSVGIVYKFFNQSVSSGVVQYDYTEQMVCEDNHGGELDLSFREKAVNEYCAEEWTKIGKLNERMFNHCHASQKESSAELHHYLSSESFPGMYQTVKRAVSDFRKRAFINYKMILHVTEQEHEAFQNLEWVWNNEQSKRAKITRCLKEYYNFVDFGHGMVNYCLREL